jgi:hypothetical protein
MYVRYGGPAAASILDLTLKSCEPPVALFCKIYLPTYRRRTQLPISSNWRSPDIAGFKRSLCVASGNALGRGNLKKIS